MRRFPKNFLRALLVLLAVGGVTIAWVNAVNSRHAVEVFTTVQPPPVPHAFQLSGRPVIRILAIDGGGVRGIVPAHVLAYLEQRTQRPVSELFDLFIGTSSGAAVITGCLLPGPDGRPLRTCDEVADAFARNSTKILNPYWLHRIVTLEGLIAPKYSSSRKQAAFQRVLGSVPFANLLKPAVISAYDLQNQCPLPVRNWDPEFSAFLVSDLLTAATTVPGMFNPVQLDAPGYPPRSLIDNGVFNNNPSFSALTIARQAAPRADILIVNIGTGLLHPDYSASIVNHWGALRWIPRYISLLSRGNAATLNTIIRSEQQYIGAPRLEYISIDVAMPHGKYYDPFDVSSENISNLRALGEQSIEINKSALDTLVERFKALPPSS